MSFESIFNHKTAKYFLYRHFTTIFGTNVIPLSLRLSCQENKKAKRMAVSHSFGCPTRSAIDRYFLLPQKFLFIAWFSVVFPFLLFIVFCVGVWEFAENSAVLFCLILPVATQKTPAYSPSLPPLCPNSRDLLQKHVFLFRTKCPSNDSFDCVFWGWSSSGRHGTQKILL